MDSEQSDLRLAAHLPGRRHAGRHRQLRRVPRGPHPPQPLHLRPPAVG